MNFTTTPLFTARVYDAYGEQIGYTTHSNAVMLESIVRGDWEGSDHAHTFTIFDEKGVAIVGDVIS